MKIYMRMLWQFDITEEVRFMELEKKFVELENRRKDYPKGGKRLQPISGQMPCNSITWVPRLNHKNSRVFFWVLLTYALCYMPTIALTTAIWLPHCSKPGKQYPGKLYNS